MLKLTTHAKSALSTTKLYYSAVKPVSFECVKLVPKGIFFHLHIALNLNPSDQLDKSVCPHCKSSIEGYQPVTGSSALVDSESTICTVSFRDYSDQVISLPSAFKISKSINSGKIYDQLNMLLFTGKFRIFDRNVIFSMRCS